MSEKASVRTRWPAKKESRLEEMLRMRLLRERTLRLLHQDIENPKKEVAVSKGETEAQREERLAKDDSIWEPYGGDSRNILPQHQLSILTR